MIILIKLNQKTKKLLLLQRNELLSKKQKWLRKKFGRLLFTNILINFFQNLNLEIKTEKLFLDEIKTFKNFLPNYPKNIMDIGCGLGIINIYLNKIYKNKPNFYLLDKNKIDKKIQYGFSQNYESYNDLNETENILKKNNINNNRIFLIDVDKKFKIKNKIDLVISLKSMGYHYPFENYLNTLKLCCTNNTKFIFDVRSENFSKSIFSNYFEFIKVIHEEKSIHSLKRLYCEKLKF